MDLDWWDVRSDHHALILILYSTYDIYISDHNGFIVVFIHLQLEEVLNRTSPFSIWINGEKIDVLEQEGQRQSKEFKNLEGRYTEMADSVDSIFSDTMKVLLTCYMPDTYLLTYVLHIAQPGKS